MERDRQTGMREDRDYMPVGDSPAADGGVSNAQARANDLRSDVGSAKEDMKERADEGMTKAGEGVQSAAESLRNRVEGQDGMAAEAGTKVADQMEKTASYLRDKDTSQLMDDVERYVKEHPVQAVAGAIVGGFIIAKVLR